MDAVPVWRVPNREALVAFDGPTCVRAPSVADTRPFTDVQAIVVEVAALSFVGRSRLFGSPLDSKGSEWLVSCPERMTGRSRPSCSE